MATDAHTIFGKLTASDLSAIIMKGSPNSSDRDAGFCSGSSDGGDDLSVENSPNSPTPTSEDSLEVKVTPIALTNSRNKRKSSEPSKVVCGEQETGPLKKRIRYNTSSSSSESSFRPWNEVKPQSTHHHLPPTMPPQQMKLPHELMPNPAEIYKRHPGVTTLHINPIKQEEEDDDEEEEEDVYMQDEPLALVAKKPANDQCEPEFKSPAKASSSSKSNYSAESPNSCNKRGPQRNYKNMTRERRIEANARERTRVHTISAAYETLRKSIPAYSSTQKLSKLSVLRVACSYILTLSRMAGYDYSQDESNPSIESCVEAVTKTIQTEGKIRKKKDE